MYGRKFKELDKGAKQDVMEELMEAAAKDREFNALFYCWNSNSHKCNRDISTGSGNRLPFDWCEFRYSDIPAHKA